jgi:hypothetical protein
MEATRTPCMSLPWLSHRMESIPCAKPCQHLINRVQNRFLSLLSGAFRGMSAPLALSILDPRLSYSDAESQVGWSGLYGK